MPIICLLGLGNPVESYAGTRHNVGKEVLDKISLVTDFEHQPPEAKYRWSRKTAGGQELILVWPTGYMNHSGEAARELLQNHNLKPDDMLVIVDDFNLKLGEIRLRASGSDGGHNGLRSLIEIIGTEKFPRLRLGIGPVPEDVSSVDFVLGTFLAEEETQIVEKMLVIAAEAAIFATRHRFEEAMTKYNNNPA